MTFVLPAARKAVCTVHEGGGPVRAAAAAGGAAAARSKPAPRPPPFRLLEQLPNVAPACMPLGPAFSSPRKFAMSPIGCFKRRSPCTRPPTACERLPPSGPTPCAAPALCCASCVGRVHDRSALKVAGAGAEQHCSGRARELVSFRQHGRRAVSALRHACRLAPDAPSSLTGCTSHSQPPTCLQEDDDEDYEDYESEEELDFDDMWAEVEAEEAAAAVGGGGAGTAAAPATYDDFASLLGSPNRSSSSAGKPKEASGKKGKSSSGAGFTARSGSLKAVGLLTDLPDRPEQKPAAPAATGRVQLSLGRKPSAPTRLAAKPQASSAAREAAQKPLPPPPAPKPTLAAPPTRPAAPAPPAAAEPAAKPAKPLAPPPLAAKPAARAAAAAPAAPPAEVPAPPAEPLAAKPKPTAKAAPAEPAPVQPPAAGPAAAAAPLEEGGPVEAAAAAAVQPDPAAPAAEAAALTPALAKPDAAAAEEAAAAAPSAPALSKPTRRAARPAGAVQPSVQQQAERRAANVAYGRDCLLSQRVETFTVWQVNAAGVLVRNERLSGGCCSGCGSACIRGEHVTHHRHLVPLTLAPQNSPRSPPPRAGFVPTSLLQPVLLSKVFEKEARLAAAAAAGLIVGQLETAGAPATAAAGACLAAVLVCVCVGGGGGGGGGRAMNAASGLMHAIPPTTPAHSHPPTRPQQAPTWTSAPGGWCGALRWPA